MSEDKIRPSLEKRLEGIISGAALLADSSCTRDVHRERIVTECNSIRQALQDLLSEYMNKVSEVSVKLVQRLVVSSALVYCTLRNQDLSKLLKSFFF